MDEEKKLTTDEAMKQHRLFLQELLRDVMTVLATGEPSAERLVEALGVYWEGCFARRAIRKRVLEATAGTQFEKSVEPMGRPFEFMVRAELQGSNLPNLDDLSEQIYQEARAIAVDEARENQRLLPRRRALEARARGK
jgi:hypothetical protein